MSRVELALRALAAVACACAVGPAGAASAQVELSGTYVRYVRVGANGRLCDGSRSTAYSEAGADTDASCDLFGLGTPAVGFTVSVRRGTTTTHASNNSSRSDIATLSAPAIAGRQITWSGRVASVPLRVEQTLAFASSERHVTLTVHLTNEGSTAIDELYYFFSGDPDHGQCRLSGSYETLNDVVRQPPADLFALATATSLTTPIYTFGLGSPDPRARANNGGFENTNGIAAWSTPRDDNGARRDEDIGIVFREEALAPGASVTFVAYLVWGRSVAEAEARLELLVDAPDGSPCGSGATCASGHCVDGVCCDEVCGGDDSSDCQACAAAAGAVADGTCTTLPSGRVCRAATGPCDAAEACNGVSSACPADALSPAGTVCRAPVDGCDATETCTGASVTCPADGLSVSGVVCRPAAGACDVAETCTGLSMACPPDVLRPAGAPCRAASGACDVPEACDGAAAACPPDALAPDGALCNDALLCNGVETCTGGLCEAGTPPRCDDEDPCTADACSEESGCTSAPIDGCCRSDADCEDGDPCTDDACTGAHVCASAPVPGCGSRLDGSAHPGADASVPAADAGDGAGRPGGAGGCGCRAAADAPSPAVLLLVPVALGVWVRRRRPRRRAP